MNTKLTIPERLKDLRVSRQLTLEQLAEQTKLSKSALGKYEADDDRDISLNAVIALASFYGVSTDYLLGLTENKKSPDAELKGLHLSDEMIALLRGGRINSRLLCEFATHPMFRRLLVDMEIIVDRVADMQIQNMNTMMEAYRQEILARNATDDNDKYLRTLEVAQVKEADYFRYIIQEDIDAILNDLRESHRKDTSTADEAPTVDTARKRIIDAMHYQNPEEAVVFYFCTQLQIPYKRLSKEERQFFVHLLRKSELLKNPKNMRGKARPLGGS